jgi:hypothetical protein
MKLYQALKKKKELVGEITKLKQQIQSENSIMVGNERNYNPEDLMDKLMIKTEELVTLKENIQKANLPILKDIYRLSELKAMMGFYSGIPTSHGKIKSYGDSEPTEYESFYKKADVDKVINKCQAEISELQEKLETFNYTTDL